MERIIDVFPGKKTYAAGALAILAGLGGWILGFLEPAEASEWVWAGITAIAIRLGIKKTE